MKGTTYRAPSWQRRAAPHRDQAGVMQREPSRQVAKLHRGGESHTNKCCYLSEFWLLGFITGSPAPLANVAITGRCARAKGQNAHVSAETDAYCSCSATKGRSGEGWAKK